MGNGLTPCTCTIAVKRGKNMLSLVTRTPKPGCPIHHVAKKATA